MYNAFPFNVCFEDSSFMNPGQDYDPGWRYPYSLLKLVFSIHVLNIEPNIELYLAMTP